MPKLVIKPFRFASRCDVRRCTARARYSVGNDGETVAAAILYCEEHLKEIVLTAAPMLGITILTGSENTISTGSNEESLILENKELKDKNDKLLLELKDIRDNTEKAIKERVQLALKTYRSATKKPKPKNQENNNPASKQKAG
jgi:hypothetical protein